MKIAFKCGFRRRVDGRRGRKGEFMKGEIANRRGDRSGVRNHAIGGAALVVSLIGAVFIGLPIAHGGGSGLHAGASGARGRVGNREWRVL